MQNTDSWHVPTVKKGLRLFPLLLNLSQSSAWPYWTGYAAMPSNNEGHSLDSRPGTWNPTCNSSRSLKTCYCSSGKSALERKYDFVSAGNEPRNWITKARRWRELLFWFENLSECLSKCLFYFFVFIQFLLNAFKTLQLLCCIVLSLFSDKANVMLQNCIFLLSQQLIVTKNIHKVDFIFNM